MSVGRRSPIPPAQPEWQAPRRDRPGRIGLASQRGEGSLDGVRLSKNGATGARAKGRHVTSTLNFSQASAVALDLLYSTEYSVPPYGVTMHSTCMYIHTPHCLDFSGSAPSQEPTGSRVRRPPFQVCSFSTISDSVDVS